MNDKELVIKTQTIKDCQSVIISPPSVGYSLYMMALVAGWRLEISSASSCCQLRPEPKPEESD